MVTWEKYARDRHRPAGEWAQTTLVEKVVGVEYRKQDALAFAKSTRKAERQGCIYGVRLELEPENPVDKNAIMVWGITESESWLGRVKQKEWHIGYLSAELAAEMQKDLLSIGIPIAAELCSIFEESGFLDFNILVLAPEGYGHAARNRAAHETPEENVSRLISEEKFDEAINLLLDCCENEEENNKANGQSVAPWCYEALAKLFRKLRLPNEENAVLQRYARQVRVSGISPSRLQA